MSQQECKCKLDGKSCDGGAIQASKKKIHTAINYEIRYCEKCGAKFESAGPQFEEDGKGNTCESCRKQKKATAFTFNLFKYTHHKENIA